MSGVIVSQVQVPQNQNSTDSTIWLPNGSATVATSPRLSADVPVIAPASEASSSILVSCVRSATDTSTKNYEAKEIIASIRADTQFPLRVPVERIRHEFSRVMTSTGGDRKAAKRAIDGNKKNLPAVMWSGTFQHRSREALSQHSGLLCADLDGLGDSLVDLRAKLVGSIHLWALFISPTGDGLKCVFQVPAGAGQHKESFRAVENHVRELTGIQIDKSCSDVSRLCFMSHDPDAYLNGDAIELAPVAKAERLTAKSNLGEGERVATKSAVSASGPEMEVRRSIAVMVVGAVAWDSETSGLCACPGKNLHTGPDGERDCRVCLDGPPTIFCFHDSCRSIITEKNYDLRSRIGMVESAAAMGAALGENETCEYARNDMERAMRFVQRHGNELRYVAAWKQWLVWDGTRWLLDSKVAAFRKAQEMPMLFLREAADIQDSDRRTKAARAALASGDEKKLNAMLNVAQYQLGIAASPSVFDSDPYLIGVTNGVVDLQTGKFRFAMKEDCITKHLAAAFNPDATCPIWEGFLQRVLNGDPDLIAFMQRAVGYSLTGDVSEQCLFFLYGTGANGKSTFIECLYKFFGDYALKATTGLYTLNKTGKEPEAELARLSGKRFVTGSETEEGAKLAESRVKDITGGDTLTGRDLYCSAFNFRPTHKLFVYGNHLPDVRGHDHGMWRRMRLVPFQAEIPDNEKDVDLPYKLRNENSGILNWAIKGSLAWQQMGLGPPSTVVEATAEYREDEDELGEFIEEMCTLSGRVGRSELYFCYKQWAPSRGTRFPLLQKAFAKRLRSRPGIGDAKSGDRYWTGISIREIPSSSVTPPAGPPRG